MLESGKLVHKIGFDIDKKSWDNLDKFQRRIGQLKKQMSGLTGVNTFKVNMSSFKQQADKVAKVQAKAQHQAQSMYNNKGGIGLEFGKAKGSDRTYSSWWTDSLKKREDTAKREQKIENMRSRMDYQMRKSGVSMQGRDAFFGGTFNKAAQSFKDTGDIQTFTTKVGLASRQMVDASRSAKTMGKSMHDMRSMMVAATQAYTVFAALQSTANTGMQLESMQAGMKVFAGSDANVKKEFDYIVEQSRRMGVNFEAAAQQYTKFNIVARNKLSTDQRKEMFESMSEYATVLQVDPEQYKRAFNAINQMLSKGTIMS